MRIIGGTLSGRRLEGSPGSHTRPTSERTREGLASALQARDAFNHANVLELFAGTGVFSFEAISRGAATALCIDRSSVCVRSIVENSRILGVADRIRVQVMDLLGPQAPLDSIELVPTGFNLVFLDPPYEAVSSVAHLVEQLVERGMLANGAWVVIEHASADEPPPISRLATAADYKYGGTSIRLAQYSEVV